MNSILFAIPHYNNANKLLRCILSIKKNTNAKDILIIDDNSRYEEYEVIKNISDSSDLVTLIKNIENKGPAYCRNLCIEYAIKNDFEYISFIDADDYLVSKIEACNLDKEDIVFYDSAEILEHNYTEDLNILKIIKYNKFKNESLKEELTNYVIRPNQINSLTSCWSKVYKINNLKKNNIRFNEKMKTFEDVDFLIRYLSIVKKYKICSNITYHHTNNLNYNGATFGSNYNSLFGYLQVCRSLTKYFGDEEINFNKSHFISCYFSITLIRIAIKIKNFKDFQYFYKFLRKKINSKLVQTAFKRYDVKKANGRKLIQLFINYKFILLLTMYVIIIGKNRYKIKG
jgi:hypothetical protein